MVHFCRSHPVVFPRITSFQPLSQALLIFTDGSSNGTAAYVLNGIFQKFHTPYSSTQMAELIAIIAILQQFPDKPCNIYTYSAYVASSVPLLETAGQIHTGM